MRRCLWMRAAFCLSAVFLAGSANAEDDLAKLRALNWVLAPAQGAIAGKATVDLTGGLRFLGEGEADKFIQILGNLPRPNSYALTSPDISWFGVFDFVADGYVKDDEKIDADALLKRLKEGNAAAEEVRRSKGLTSLVLDGWSIAPRYDAENKRLEFATLLSSPGSVRTVNYSTKLLGRSGYTTAILVTNPDSQEKDVREFKAALKSFQYVPGERYSEWKQGDKVAAYGLGALIVGGAAALATKKGFWAVLAGTFAAFWKVIVGVGIALLVGIGKVFKKKTD